MTRPSPEFIDALAGALADRLAVAWTEQTGGAEVVDAARLGERLGVSAQWVREHAEDLGGWRLGDGPKAPYRFDADKAEGILRGPAAPDGSESPRPRARLRHRSLNPDLLPVRGDDPT